jgi:hypothetical protein
MKIIRRRRPFRPRPSRSQINQQIRRVSQAMQLFQLEWLVEAHKPQPSLPRLQFLNAAVSAMRDEIADLERV